MPKMVLTLLGTKKGAFVLESDAARQSWSFAALTARHGR